MPPDISCYSVRQLSPFVGNIQLIEADYCRALSADGIQWQIQASCETNQQMLNIPAVKYIPRRYVLFGSWTQASGFSGLPLDPMLDVPSLEHVENTLISTLEHAVEQLPFPQLDHYECWLMDQHLSSPLALVNSATHDYMIPHIQDKRWQALPQQALQSLPTSLQTETIQQLESCINHPSNRLHWFHRQKNRSGISITDPSNCLPADRFPELLINLSTLPEQLLAPARDYLHWLSPRLLGLHYLSQSCRHKLEQSAQCYALETRRRMSIYPQPLQQKILNKIMVELKLREH